MDYTMTAVSGREDGRNEIFPNGNMGDDSIAFCTSTPTLLPPSAAGVRRSLSKGQTERRGFYHLQMKNVSFQFSDLNNNNDHHKNRN